MLNRPLHEYPMRKLERPEPRVEVRRSADGIVYLSCGLLYEAGLASLIDHLARAAEIRPDTTFLAERDSFIAALHHRDGLEGISAFLEKRPAVYR